MGETIGQAVHPLRCLRSAACVAERQSSHHAIPGMMRSANDALSEDDEGSQASNNALLIHEFARRSGAWSWCRVFSMRRGRCQIRAVRQTVLLLQAALTNIIRNRSHIEKKPIFRGVDCPGSSVMRTCLLLWRPLPSTAVRRSGFADPFTRLVQWQRRFRRGVHSLFVATAVAQEPALPSPQLRLAVTAIHDPAIQARRRSARAPRGVRR